LCYWLSTHWFTSSTCFYFILYLCLTFLLYKENSWNWGKFRILFLFEFILLFPFLICSNINDNRRLSLWDYPDIRRSSWFLRVSHIFNHFLLTLKSLCILSIHECFLSKCRYSSFRLPLNPLPSTLLAIKHFNDHVINSFSSVVMNRSSELIRQ
jgi:hypothetical protein